MMRSRVQWRDLVGGLSNAAATAVLAFVAFFALDVLVAYQTRHAGPSATYAYVVQAGGEGVPVLCHHFLRNDARPITMARILSALFFNMPVIGDMSVWTQTRSAFDAQMRYLSENGYTAIDPEDLEAWQRGERSLPEKSVLITFDDGDRSVLTHALPILEKYDLRATLYVVTSEVGNKWDEVDNLTWDELRELRDSGRFSLQSHTHDMHYKVRTRRGHLPVFLAAARRLHKMDNAPSWREAVFEDLTESRRLMQEELEVDARFLAWPYGRGSAELDSIAVAAGFDAIATLTPGKNLRRHALLAPASQASGPPAPPFVPNWQRFEVKRFAITARTSVRTFAYLLEGPAHPPVLVSGSH